MNDICADKGMLLVTSLFHHAVLGTETLALNLPHLWRRSHMGMRRLPLCSLPVLDPDVIRTLDPKNYPRQRYSKCRRYIWYVNQVAICLYPAHDVAGAACNHCCLSLHCHSGVYASFLCNNTTVAMKLECELQDRSRGLPAGQLSTNTCLVRSILTQHETPQ